jgi:hypothetical protein
MKKERPNRALAYAAVICNLLPACSSTNMTANGGPKRRSDVKFGQPSFCRVVDPMPRQDHRSAMAFSFPETFAARPERFGPLVAMAIPVIRRFLLILGALVIAVDAGSFVFQGSESSTLTAAAVVTALIAALALSYRRGDARGVVARERPAAGFPNPALVANRTSAAAGEKLAA